MWKLLEFNIIKLFDKSYDDLLNMNLCLSCSCGKDSVGVALLCYENNIPLKYIVRYLNGAEWDCLDNVWNKLKQLYSNTSTLFIDITGPNLLNEIVQSRYYYINGQKVFGKTFCGIFSRFGTDSKINSLENFCKENNCIDVVGLAYDELSRKKQPYKSYPAVELKLTSKDLLSLCRKYNFHWYEYSYYLNSFIDLYDYVDRLSCWCCSFINLKQINLLVKHFPQKYEILKELQASVDVPFKLYSSAFNLINYVE